MLKYVILAIDLAATPAIACTDWKAVAAFDAIIVANAQRDGEDMNRDFEKVLNAGNKLSAEQVYTSTQCMGKETSMTWK